MLSQGGSFLLFLLCQALALPLPTQLSKEDEKVIKCISEILADTLSRPSPIPMTSECMKTLREDERVLAMLHHRHLLTELEEVAHQENAKHHLDHAWEAEQQGDVKKRDEAAPEKMEEPAEERKKEKEEEEEERKTYEEAKTTQEESKVSQGEALQDSLEEKAEEQRQQLEEEEIKKRSSTETWSSKEYFGHIKKRGPKQPQIRKGMPWGVEEGRHRHDTVKRRLRVDEEEDDDPSEEGEPKEDHRGGYRDHENWEEEEKRSHVAKRVAEKASDEETAQFEQEEKEKGLKISSSKAHLHKGWKPWRGGGGEEEEEEEEQSKMRHGHHRKSVGLDLRKRHWKDEVDVNGRPHALDEDEEGREAGQRKVQEVEKVEEIERELEQVADKLEELKRG